MPSAVFVLKPFPSATRNELHKYGSVLTVSISFNHCNLIWQTADFQPPKAIRDCLYSTGLHIKKTDRFTML